VYLRRQCRSNKETATARFHTDEAMWNLRRKDHPLRTGKPLPGPYLAMMIDPRQMEDALAQINAKTLISIWDPP
jgi:hypothetical protein